jgi:teichuronic acid biosynthesis glycosyltransferase TuaC
VRVLTFTSLFPNSTQQNLGVFVYQRMAAFAARGGNSVEVIAPVPHFPIVLGGGRWGKLKGIPGQEKIGSITVHHPRYALMPAVSMPIHAWLMYTGSLELAKKLHRENPYDCVDAHFVYPDGKAGLLIGQVLGIPTIVSARGSDIHRFTQLLLIRPQIRKTLRAAAGRVAVSEALRTVMVEVAGANCEVCVIGNGVDAKRFFPVEGRAARKELALPQEGRIVVAVAALVPVKGQELLLCAFAQIVRKFPDLQLYLIGEGTSRRRLEQLAETLGLRERVHLPGSCPNERLRYWYSAADLSCLASSREGWPNVLLESLACGTPVVATRVWGIPEVLSSPEYGILVEQTEDSLAFGIETALTRSWNRDALVTYARSREWSVVAREVEGYFKKVVARKN